MHPAKLWNLRREFSRPGKSRTMTVVMESHGKVVEFHIYVMEFFNRRIIILGI